MKVGVLALQGAFARHLAAFESMAVAAIEVRTERDLLDVGAIVIPGGESTTISMLLDRCGLRAALAERLADGLPALGTCAGAITLGRDVLDGRPDQRSFGAIDVAVRRNAYGRQVDSFEADLAVTALAEPFRGVFIRAPVIESVGDGVEVLATVHGSPVLCRQGPVVVSTFHPELAGDTRLHEQFVEFAGGA